MGSPTSAALAARPAYEARRVAYREWSAAEWRLNKVRDWRPSPEATTALAAALDETIAAYDAFLAADAAWRADEAVQP
jgi:hypothetical protein